MAFQSVSTDLTVAMGKETTTELIKACGKLTGTIGSEVTEGPAAVTVSGIITNCPDPE